MGTDLKEDSKKHTAKRSVRLRAVVLYHRGFSERYVNSPLSFFIPGCCFDLVGEHLIIVFCVLFWLFFLAALFHVFLIQQEGTLDTTRAKQCEGPHMDNSCLLQFRKRGGG